MRPQALRASAEMIITPLIDVLLIGAAIHHELVLDAVLMAPRNPGNPNRKLLDSE